MAKTVHQYFKEAKEILKSTGKENIGGIVTVTVNGKKKRVRIESYTDLKAVKKACRLVYKAVLKSIDDYLLRNKKSDRKNLPSDRKEYFEAVKKYLPEKISHFNSVYNSICVGVLQCGKDDVFCIYLDIEDAKRFVKKISPS